VRPRTILALAAPLLLVSGAAALTLPGRPRPVPACAAPEIRVYKARSSLELRCGGAVKARYPTTFGASPAGNKERRGDERTPEGAYRVTAKVQSDRFHRYLALSYPSAADWQRAHEHGVRDPGAGRGHTSQPGRGDLRPGAAPAQRGARASGDVAAAASVERQAASTAAMRGQAATSRPWRRALWHWGTSNRSASVSSAPIE
jgi:hypothetical protein